MAEIPGRVEKQPFKRRVFPLVALALVAWFVLNVLTSHLDWFGKGPVYRTAADVFYSLQGLVIIFSGFLVYSALYVRGASLQERIFWSNSVPLAWITKEIWRVSDFFTWGESFYYALSPIPLGLMLFQLFSLCLCEIFWRWRFKKKKDFIRIFTPGPVIGLFLFAGLIYFMLFWGNAGDTPGSHLFYLYMEGYKTLYVN